ncbi:hypothetical protein V6N13_100961 [Hibiscus sabdariffa]
MMLASGCLWRNVAIVLNTGCGNNEVDSGECIELKGQRNVESELMVIVEYWYAAPLTFSVKVRSLGASRWEGRA